MSSELPEKLQATKSNSQTAIAFQAVKPAVLDQDGTQQILQLLVEKCEAIGGKNLKNLKDRLEVVRSISVPVFRGKVVSLLESRSFHSTERPHLGESVPAKTVSKSNIQPWSYSFSQADSYEQRKDASEISDSREVQTCYECTGEGEVTCHTCSGNKQVTCTGCKGQTKIACPKCHGRREVNEPYWEEYTVDCENCVRLAVMSNLTGIPAYCGTCGNRGWLEKKRQIDNWVPCVNCTASGEVTCGRCRGSGRIDCSICVGGGLVTCGQCDGKRNLVHALVVQRELVPEIRQAIYAPAGIGQDVIDLLTGSDYTRIVDEHHSVITVGMIESAEPSKFRTDLQSHIADIHRLTGNNKRYHRMWLGVASAVVDVLDYRFERQKFRAFFVGKSKRCHAPISPATWSVESKVRQAFALWEEYEFPDAIAAYRQCLKMAKKDEDCRRLLLEYQRKHKSWLPTFAKYGILIGALLTIGALSGLFLLVQGCV